MRKRDVPVTVSLIGDTPNAQVNKIIDAARRSGLEVAVKAQLSRERLASELQTFDVFVIPSHQEGLCIAALEAMASGCPAVSTRCGGPEDFVIEGQTGHLVASTPVALAAAVSSIVLDRGRREDLGQAARSLVMARYSKAAAEKTFWRCFNAAFHECGAA